MSNTQIEGKNDLLDKCRNELDCIAEVLQQVGLVSRFEDVDLQDEDILVAYLSVLAICSG